MHSHRNFNSQKYHSYDKNPADDYETPDWFFKLLQKKFNIAVDIACDSHNCKIPGSPLFDQGFNALDADWSKFPGVKFCYPPFSKPFFGQFLQKAHNEWRNGEESIVIAPLKTVTVDYFQQYRAPKIHVIYPRLNFLYNGRGVDAADAVCVLHYDISVDGFTVPNLFFLDVKPHVPNAQYR